MTAPGVETPGYRLPPCGLKSVGERGGKVKRKNPPRRGRRRVSSSAPTARRKRAPTRYWFCWLPISFQSPRIEAPSAPTPRIAAAAS